LQNYKQKRKLLKSKTYWIHFRKIKIWNHKWVLVRTHLNNQGCLKFIKKPSIKIKNLKTILISHINNKTVIESNKFKKWNRSKRILKRMKAKRNSNTLQGLMKTLIEKYFWKEPSTIDLSIIPRPLQEEHLSNLWIKWACKSSKKLKTMFILNFKINWRPIW